MKRIRIMMKKTKIIMILLTAVSMGISMEACPTLTQPLHNSAAPSDFLSGGRSLSLDGTDMPLVITGLEPMNTTSGESDMGFRRSRVEERL